MERRAGIPSNKIIVGGFSQGILPLSICRTHLSLSSPQLFLSIGAALALYCALHYPEPLAGCIALSTFFPEAKLPKPGDLTNKGKQIVSNLVLLFFACYLGVFQIFHFSKLMGKWTQYFHSRYIAVLLFSKSF